MSLYAAAIDNRGNAQAAEAAAPDDPFGATSAACSRGRGGTSPADTAAASAAPPLKSREPEPDPHPVARLLLERTSSAAEADALLADIAATVTASEFADAHEAHTGAPLPLQEPAAEPAAALNGLGAAPAADWKRGDAISVRVDCGSGLSFAAAHAIWAAPASQPFSSGSADALWRSVE